jgi:basic membrane lipoprotein Med (substrate-binding protein (PBP1-ABC) superfamily)
MAVLMGHALWRLVCALSMMAVCMNAYAYGALAIDHNQGSRYGYSYNFSNSAGAEQYALNQCGQGCQIVVSFNLTCAAYAGDQTADSGIYGWGYDENPKDAQDRALYECKKQGGKSCMVRVWACDASE